MLIHRVYETRWRRRRPWLIMIPVCSLFLGLGLIFLLPNESGIDNTVPGVVSTGLGLVLVAGCLYGAIATGEKSKTLQQLEAMPRTRSTLVWFQYAHPRDLGGYCFAVIAADTLYFSEGLDSVMMDTINRVVSDQMFVSLFELDNFMKRYFCAFMISDVQTIETWQDKLVISTTDDVTEFSNVGATPVATELASLLLPGVVGVTKIHENAQNTGGISSAFNPDIERLIFSRSNAPESIDPNFDEIPALHESDWSRKANSIGDRSSVDRVAARIGETSQKRRWRVVLGYLLAIFVGAYLTDSAGTGLIRDYGPAATTDAIIFAVQKKDSGSSISHLAFGQAENGERFEFTSRKLFDAYLDQPNSEMEVTLEYSTITGGPREVQTSTETFRRSLLDMIGVPLLYLVGLVATLAMLVIVANASYRLVALPIVGFLIPAALWLAWLSWV